MDWLLEGPKAHLIDLSADETEDESGSESDSSALSYLQPPDDLDGELALDLGDNAISSVEALVAPVLPGSVAESENCETSQVCAEKAIDSVALAKKRVRIKLRKEKRAARRAKRKERAKAKLRRGAGADLEEFLSRTRSRVEEACLTQSVSEVTNESLETRQLSSVDLESFRKRVRKWLNRSSRSKVKQVEVVTPADESDANEKLNEFRKKTRARLVQQFWSKLPQVRYGLVSCDSLESQAEAFPRRRIAVVGAGPVGLWAALLLMRKYRSKVLHRQRPDAPEVVVIEARPEEVHCARKDIRIALSASTQSLLNKRSQSNGFVSGIPVADIENILLQSLKRLAPQQVVRFGHPVDNPAGLAKSEGFDCILWASGRRSLDANVRCALECETRVGDSEHVLVFQLGKIDSGTDIRQLVTHDLTGIARQKCPGLRVMVRPGLGGTCVGWLWLFGLPQEAVASASYEQPIIPMPTMVEALKRVLNVPLSPSASCICDVVETLQQRVRAEACTVRWVDASFWSSDHVVCDLARCDDSVSASLVLLGDAACGKPFYTGTTLNRHFWDVATFVDEVDWIHDGTPQISSRFEAHERRYQAELLRTGEFRRRCGAPSPPPPIPEHPAQPSFERQTRSPPVSSPKCLRVPEKLSPSHQVRSTSSKALVLPHLIADTNSKLLLQ
jgi:hypothetical protein